MQTQFTLKNLSEITYKVIQSQNKNIGRDKSFPISILSWRHSPKSYFQNQKHELSITLFSQSDISEYYTACQKRNQKRTTPLKIKGWSMYYTICPNKLDIFLPTKLFPSQFLHSKYQSLVHYPLVGYWGRHFVSTRSD